MLQVKNLKKYFPVEKGLFRIVSGYVRAVDNVSFEIKDGEVFGIVGESGCGKTTLARVIAGLIPPDSGEIILDGMNVFKLKKREYYRKVQMIFQDPFSSLNPRMKVFSQIAEGIKNFEKLKGLALKRRVARLLEMVGMPPDCMERYPHEFSGGQRQRIGIARALAVNPKLLIADEPVSSLDVSVQAQILNLLKDLQKKLNLSMIFISHDLGVVKYMSDTIGVMYLGRILEIGPSTKILEKPLHPYTMALLEAVPEIGKPVKIVVKGEPPDPAHPPSGCPFNPRCPYAKQICRDTMPKFEWVGDRGVACHFPLG